MAERLARDLADRGLVIASGLARGIDASAHQGALSSACGATIGGPWLRDRRDLPEGEQEDFRGDRAARASSSANSPWALSRRPRTFPFATGSSPAWRWELWSWRGRSILDPDHRPAGMEFGREVYGVPGNATQAMSFGPNQLIKQGAKLVTSWEDVVEELPTPVRAELMPVETASSRRTHHACRRESAADRAAALRSPERGRSPARRRNC